MAEISFRLNKREAAALAVDRRGLWGVRVPKVRESAEFKMRQAIWSAYPELLPAAPSEQEGSQ